MKTEKTTQTIINEQEITVLAVDKTQTGFAITDYSNGQRRLSLGKYVIMEGNTEKSTEDDEILEKMIQKARELTIPELSMLYAIIQIAVNETEKIRKETL